MDKYYAEEAKAASEGTPAPETPAFTPCAVCVATIACTLNRECFKGAPPEITAPIFTLPVCDCGGRTWLLKPNGWTCSQCGTLLRRVSPIASSATPTPEPTRAALERIKTVYGRQEVSLVDRAYLMYAIATRALTTEPR